MTHSPLSEEELRRLYQCVFYDKQDGVDREDMFIKEVGIVVDKLITAQKEAWQREAAKNLLDKIARYGDGAIVHHNNEAVVPISDVLHELVGINELKKENK